MRQGPGRGLGGGRGGDTDLGMPAARQFTMCNTCLSAPCVPLCKGPFTIRMTELFISCARMIDMSYLWKPCLSSTGVWALLFSRQTAHMALFDALFPDSDLACRRYQRGDLSHAIMAENKGDEVCRIKESKGSKGLEWKLITIKGEASTHWMPWYECVSVESVNKKYWKCRSFFKCFHLFQFSFSNEFFYFSGKHK